MEEYASNFARQRALQGASSQVWLTDVPVILSAARLIGS